MADIFISFIHEDGKVAEGLKTFLRDAVDRSHKVFLSSDKWAIFAGEDWLQKIKEELASSKVVVLLLSKMSVGRPWVNFEAGGASLTNKVIIPACFGDMTISALPKPYSNLQALSLDDEDGPYYLVTSVCHHLKPSGIVRPPFSQSDPEIIALRKVLEEAARRLPEHL